MNGTELISELKRLLLVLPMIDSQREVILQAIAFVRAFEGCRAKVDCLTRGEITQ